MPLLHLIPSSGFVITTEEVFMPTPKAIARMMKIKNVGNLDSTMVLWHGALRVMFYDGDYEGCDMNKRAARINANVKFSKSPETKHLVVGTFVDELTGGEPWIPDGLLALWEGNE